MLALCCCTAALAGSAPVAGVSPASSPYYGRWTVDDESPVFTARGRLYKTIDVAPCGRDFCGVSVDDAGTCGATLFRFFGRRANGHSFGERSGSMPKFHANYRRLDAARCSAR
jgi:hypothetical protein